MKIWIEMNRNELKWTEIKLNVAKYKHNFISNKLKRILLDKKSKII